MKGKTQKKQQEKVIQDRTFGLKNKNKSKTVQNYVKGVANTVKNAGKSPAQLEAEYYQKKKQKKANQEQAALLNALYADAKKLGGMSDSDQQDEDPANTVCPYFKQGLCQKGKKCIYSHDLTIGRTQQIDLYTDQRTQLIMNAIGGKQMDKLTEDQLNKILGQKQRQMMKGTRSKIVCKHFLEAAQKQKYGWKWNCPNGDLCKYKHCLPPGYILRKDETGKGKIEIDQVSIQERIDQQRNQLMSKNKGSPLVTLQVFMKWKEERRIKKQKQAQQKKKQLQKKKGKGQLKTGVQLFQYDPTLFIDDQQAAGEYVQEEYVEEQQEEEKEEGMNQINEDDEKMEQDNQETNQQPVQQVENS